VCENAFFDTCVYCCERSERFFFFEVPGKKKHPFGRVPSAFGHVPGTVLAENSEGPGISRARKSCLKKPGGDGSNLSRAKARRRCTQMSATWRVIQGFVTPRTTVWCPSVSVAACLSTEITLSTPYQPVSGHSGGQRQGVAAGAGAGERSFDLLLDGRVGRSQVRGEVPYVGSPCEACV
jgi:hypothetical protein